MISNLTINRTNRRAAASLRIQILTPSPDQLHLRLEPHPEPLLHLPLRALDEPAHVRGRGVAGVDEVVRVHRRHLRTSNLRAFEPRGFDQLPSRAGTVLLLPARSRWIL